MTTQKTIQNLVDIDTMASILGVDKSWIYGKTRLGVKSLIHVKVGKYLRFNPEKVIDFLQEQSMKN